MPGNCAMLWGEEIRSKLSLSMLFKPPCWLKCPWVWLLLPSLSHIEAIDLHRVFAGISLSMTEETTTKKDCISKKSSMLAYGVIQITATVVSAISLAAIALGVCSIKQESKVFNGCVEETIATGRSNAEAVRFCNGGNWKGAVIPPAPQSNLVPFELGVWGRRYP